jgi:hypothetical protein
MRKLMLAMAAVSTLALSAFGCSRSLHQAKANYHEDRADRAARHGHFGTAIREDRKAAHEEREADRAPLP